MKRSIILAAAFALTAIVQAVVGYVGFERRGSTVSAAICYVLALAAATLAIRSWNRRHILH